MAYDYLTWISLKRPLSEREKIRRIDAHKPVATDAADAHTVFSMDDTVLEVCDGGYPQQGWALFAFLIGFPLLFFLAASTALSSIDVPAAIVKSGDAFWFSVSGWIESAIALAGCAVTVFFLRKDCFNYRHKSVRFNRRTKTVYAFRHNGPGGVIQVPWETAFFYSHRQASNKLQRDQLDVAVLQSAFAAVVGVLRCAVQDASSVIEIDCPETPPPSRRTAARQEKPWILLRYAQRAARALQSRPCDHAPRSTPPARRRESARAARPRTAG